MRSPFLSECPRSRYGWGGEKKIYTYPYSVREKKLQKRTTVKYKRTRGFLAFYLSKDDTGKKISHFRMRVNQNHDFDGDEIKKTKRQRFLDRERASSSL